MLNGEIDHDVIKLSWLTTDIGAVVLGAREVLNITPVVDLVGTAGFELFAGLALLAGVVSIANDINEYV